ncbi:MAG: hypothetical protein IPM17_10120 [Verrucomicrobia bacterium]|nr:hypothetical protein [Verrucomicrobiota bacterium]
MAGRRRAGWGIDAHHLIPLHHAHDPFQTTALQPGINPFEQVETGLPASLALEVVNADLRAADRPECRARLGRHVWHKGRQHPDEREKDRPRGDLNVRLPISARSLLTRGAGA